MSVKECKVENKKNCPIKCVEFYFDSGRYYDFECINKTEYAEYFKNTTVRFYSLLCFNK